MGGRDLDADDLLVSTVRVVRYMLKLKLPPARWERVASIFEAAIDAAAANDLEGVRKAADALVLVSPVRIIKGDGPPAVPADQKISERANVLIFTLQSMRPESPASAQDKGSTGR